MIIKRIGAVFVLSIVGAAAAGLTPYSLESEARRNPIGIERPVRQEGNRLVYAISSGRYELQVRDFAP